ncbi:MAG: FHA domain-containing protein [Acidimicrobiia bacterium]
MPESLLTVLKFCLLALVYLFLARVVRVVVLELRSEKVPTGPVLPATPSAPSAPAAAAPMAAPPAPRRGKGPGPALQVVVTGPYEAEIFPLDDEVTVGRAPGCGVVLTDDTFVSQVHARVFRRNRAVLVEDLGSTNGTFVNGDRIDTITRIRKGDTVKFGETVMRVIK